MTMHLGCVSSKLHGTTRDQEGKFSPHMQPPIAIAREMAQSQERSNLEATADQCPMCRAGLQTHTGRDPLERWRKKRLCQEAWKQRHRGAYLEQKRELAHRPEYLAKRRALYAQKQATIRPRELTG